MSSDAKITTKALAPWFGCARMMAKHIGRELAGCRWVGIPFAGGMPEVLTIDAPSIAVNDTHLAVINLARIAADQELGPQLYRRLRRLPFHPDVIREAQCKCTQCWNPMADVWGTMDNSTSRQLRLSWAIDYFVATWMGRSGQAGTDDELRSRLSTRWNGNGGDSNTRFRSAVRSLIGWRRALARCSFTTIDASEFLLRCQDIEANGIYCDPPFPGPGDRYAHKLSVGEHGRLALALAAFKEVRVVCRFYDHPLIRDLYPEDAPWVWRRFKGRKQSNAEAPEVLVLNGPSREVESLF